MESDEIQIVIKAKRKEAMNLQLLYIKRRNLEEYRYFLKNSLHEFNVEINAYIQKIEIELQEITKEIETILNS